MPVASTPEEETARLATLRSLDVLDSPPDDRLDALTAMARRLFNVPTALIVLIDEHRQWVKSGAPFPPGLEHRELAFCAHTILAPALFIVQDARRDERFHDHPLVTGEDGIRFYAGYPIIAADGSRIGSFCLFDTLSRDLDVKGAEFLQELANMAGHTIERNLVEARMRRAEQVMQDNEKRLALAIAGSGTGIWDRDVVNGTVDYSAGWKAILGYAPHELTNRIEDSVERLHPDDRDYVRQAMRAHFDGLTDTYAVEHRIRCKDGSYKWISSRGKVTDRDANGRALRMVGTTTDITELRTLAGRLQDTVDLVTSLTNEVPGLVFQARLAPNGHSFVSYASAGIEEIFELTADDVGNSTRPVRDLIHPDDVATYDAAMAASARDLSPLHLEYRVVLPRQGVRWRQGDATPRRLPDGSVIWHGFITDITGRKQIEHELQEFATVDFLTRLPNRRHFMRCIEEELVDVVASGKPSAVLMCDLDYFKAINDEWGHAAGDLALKHFARLLRHALGPGDIVGRVGGEEFAVVLPGANMEAAMAFARLIREHTASQPFVDGGQVIPLTVSIGVAALTPADGTAELSLSRSDMALYRAKKNGRNRVEAY
jgi:diguanylate cyclase (GGDEF)-like protein/PAS domain S-box-containing protein